MLLYDLSKSEVYDLFYRFFKNISCCFRLRYKGEKFMHTKWVLLAIVLLNIVDCVLVMGELILDIYYLKGSFKHFYIKCVFSKLIIFHVSQKFGLLFFFGLGFKGTSLSMGKIITMSYKMKCTEFRLTHEFTSVTATQLQKSFRWFCLICISVTRGCRS